LEDLIIILGNLESILLIVSVAFGFRADDFKEEEGGYALLLDAVVYNISPFLEIL
jgi:hypothetical protein